jgi:hypothetical protein
VIKIYSAKFEMNIFGGVQSLQKKTLREDFLGGL